MSHMFGGNSALEDQMRKQQAQQEQMLKQQQEEQQRKEDEVQKERTAALRGRFGGSGMADDSSQGAQSNVSAASLYSMLTGNNQ